jgi:catechol 2,3-dioxygenase-like lactoylglutathione lyase family enzyme
MTPPGLSLQPMIHVADMASAVTFYEALGATIDHGSRDGDFTLMRLGDSRFSLLAHPPNPEQDEGQVELNFTTGDDLRRVEEHLRSADVDIVAPATDTGFGAQLQIRTPDGLLVKINQLDPGRYA